ncbi:MAG TPA: polysaccharide deacetylase family protein [Planctomycetaceae bacterium]|nr:polysaccharide deacetylase family protein [Planctomycetaceae bacterium]
MDPSPLNGFTIDVEDYFQVGAFAGEISPKTWDQYESRVVANTERILQMLDQHQTRATFFILGWVAERYPELVRRIDRGGHEIGSHSYWHQLIYEQTPDVFREDLRQSCDCLEQLIGRKIRLFRAPSFSIVNQSLWSLQVLAEQGIELDSSIFPIHHDRYGIPGAQIRPYCHQLGDRRMWEFPPTVTQISRWNFPVGGGGYLRLYPRRLTEWLLSTVNARGDAFQIYIHPWEVDPDQPRLRGSLKSRFRHYVNLATTVGKLESLLKRFRFGTLSDTLSQEIDKGQRLTGLAS